jgi:hypothetical protein
MALTVVLASAAMAAQAGDRVRDDAEALKSKAANIERKQERARERGDAKKVERMERKAAKAAKRKEQRQERERRAAEEARQKEEASKPKSRESRSAGGSGANINDGPEIQRIFDKAKVFDFDKDGDLDGAGDATPPPDTREHRGWSHQKMNTLYWAWRDGVISYDEHEKASEHVRNLYNQERNKFEAENMRIYGKKCRPGSGSGYSGALGEC